MRKIRSKKLGRQKQLVILSSFLLLTFFSVGYAAFSTTITLNAKGNVHPAPTYTVEQLKATALTEGTTDGLYVDSAEQGRYVFKGANPNNYLTINNETWRIVSIESDNSLKIVREESIGNIPFDPGRATVIAGITEAGSDIGTRFSALDTDFCYYSNNGCKVWGSKDTVRNSSGVLLKDVSGDGSAKMQRILTNSTTYDLPNDEAYLNIYLNGGTYAGVTVAGWYDTWSQDISVDTKDKILANHLWNIGLVSKTTLQLENIIQEENAYKWQGTVGLMAVSDYIRASNSVICTDEGDPAQRWLCDSNYLQLAGNYWTITPDYYNSSAVWASNSNNLRYSLYPRNTFGVRPVLYLSSDVQLKGEGTSGSKFQIK